MAQTEFSIFCLSQTCFSSVNLCCDKGNKLPSQKFESPLWLPPTPVLMPAHHQVPSHINLTSFYCMSLCPGSAWCLHQENIVVTFLFCTLGQSPFIWHHLRPPPPPSLTLLIPLVWSKTPHVTLLLKSSTVLLPLNSKLTGMACRDLHEWIGSSITASICLLSYTPFPQPWTWCSSNIKSLKAFRICLHVLAGAGRSARNITPSSYFLVKVCSFFTSLIRYFLTCETFQTSPRQFGVVCVLPVL